MFNTHRTQRSRRAAVGLAAAAASFALVLTGCSQSSDAAEPKSTASSESSQAIVTAQDMWVKATDPDIKPGEAMSGVFGTLENHGDEDLVITALESDAAGIVELHEVVDGKMRKIQGDVKVPAGGSILLEPGANHIMLMDITRPLSPGDDVTVKLTFSDGSKLTIDALIKDTAGANESYDDIDGGEMDHGDMDMSGDADAMDHG